MLPAPKKPMRVAFIWLTRGASCEAPEAASCRDAPRAQRRSDLRCGPARHDAFRERLAGPFGRDPDGAAADREYALRAIARLARRAQEAGRLRPDFVLDDLILVLMANGGIRASTPAAAVAASRRFAALAIQAFQASPQASRRPPAAPLTPVVLIS